MGVTDSESLVNPLLDKKGGAEGRRAKSGGHDDDLDASLLEKGVPVTDWEAGGHGVPEGKAGRNSDVAEDLAEATGRSSFFQTVLNILNLLLGMALLALPACLEEAGWLSLLLLLAFAIISCYTGILFGRMLRAQSRFKTYMDIGEGAFGTAGRILANIFMYLEILAYLIGITVAIGDNLARIFPNAFLHLPWLDVTMKPTQVLATAAILVAIPTTWLRDLSSLSFVSFGGVVTSLVVLGSVVWTGLFGGVGFTKAPPRLVPSYLPIVVGIYGFCFAGHILLPNIYRGMKNPSRFPQALIVSFALAFCLFAGMGVLGSTMFGDDIESQVTLNIPKHLTVSWIALWMAVLTPMTKFGLGVTPIAVQIEALLPFPSESRTHRLLGIGIRTLLMLAVLATALAAPFFYNILSLYGASVALTLAITFPAIFYMRIFRTSLSRTETVCGIFCIIWGISSSVIGTTSSLKAFIADLSSSN